jgi:hypothetical protein
MNFCLTGRNAGSVHDLFSETLRTLHLRAGRDGPESGDAYFGKLVDETLYERSLGADDDEIGIVRAGPRRYRRDVLGSHVDVRRDCRSAGIAGRAKKIMLYGIVRKSPGHRMLATAAAYN